MYRITFNTVYGFCKCYITCKIQKKLDSKTQMMIVHRIEMIQIVFCNCYCRQSVGVWEASSRVRTGPAGHFRGVCCVGVVQGMQEPQDPGVPHRLQLAFPYVGCYVQHPVED